MTVGNEPTIPVGDQVRALVAAFLTSEAEQTVRDMARHVGDEVHGVLTRHGMTMKTTAGAIGVGVLAAAQVLGDTLEFARRSMDGDADDEALTTAAIAKLFADVMPAELAALRPSARDGECERLSMAKSAGSREESEYRLNEIRDRIRQGGDIWGVADWDDVRDYVFNAAKARAALSADRSDPAEEREYDGTLDDVAGRLA